MGKPHLLELRQRAVALVEAGNTHPETTHRLCVSIKFVNDNAKPDLTIDELTADLDATHGLAVHRSSIGRLLHRLGLTHKTRPSGA